MKYIRTKDRIIDTTQSKEGFLCKQKCWQPKRGWLVYEHDIIEEGENLNQLIDVFIETWFGRSSTVKGKYIFDGEEGGLRKNLFFTSKDMEIYGAIWVTGEQGEPILKSVAKMNKEGELELL